MALSLTETIDSLLGKPFRFRGRGPEEFDCLGLVIYLYREVYGIELSDPFKGSLSEGIQQFKSQFYKLPDLSDLQSGDVLYLGLKHKISDQHVAFVESRRWNVSSIPESGVCRVRLKAVSWYDQIDVYRYGSRN